MRDGPHSAKYITPPPPVWPARHDSLVIPTPFVEVGPPPPLPITSFLRANATHRIRNCNYYARIRIPDCVTDSYALQCASLSGIVRMLGT